MGVSRPRASSLVVLFFWLVQAGCSDDSGGQPDAAGGAVDAAISVDAPAEPADASVSDAADTADARSAADALGGADAFQPDADPGDVTPPAFVDATPAGGTAGLPVDAVVAIEFSEAMDTASAQSAFSITSPAGFGGGSFSWQNGDTVMTYTPPQDFAHGDVVTWQVSTAATDVAGNSLPSAASESFQIIQRTTVTLPGSAALDGHVHDTGNVYASGQSLTPGHTTAGPSWMRGFLSFSTASIPQDVTGVVSATLNVYHRGTLGSPYSAYGTLFLDHVNYGGVLESSDYATALLTVASVALPSTNATGWRNLDVTAMVADDISNRATRRGDRSQFRLRFGADTDPPGTGAAWAEFAPADNNITAWRPTLEVTYEHP